MSVLPWKTVNSIIQKQWNIFQDNHLHLLDSKVDILPLAPEEFLQGCYDEYMMSLVDKITWKKIIKEYFAHYSEFLSQYHDLSATIMDSFFVSEKLQVVSRDGSISILEFREQVYCHLRNFRFRVFIDHACCSLIRIIEDESLSWYPKIRKIRGLLLLYPNIPDDYFQFDGNQWKHFACNLPFYLEKQYSWERIRETIVYHLPFPETDHKIKIVNFSLHDYQFFSVGNISVPNVDASTLSMDRFLISNFLDKDTHVENGILWVKNEKPYYIHYDEQPITSESFHFHRNKQMDREALYRIPIHLLSNSEKNIIVDYFSKKSILPMDTWNFISKSSQSLGVILEKCFHILARTSSAYPSSAYHESLLRKIERKIIYPKKLHCMPVSICFPEFFFQTKEIQNDFEKQWKALFVEFENCFVSDWLSVVNSGNPTPTPTYSFPTFNVVEKDLTEYFGNQHMFDVLSQKKSYMQYFNEQVFFTINYSTDLQKKRLVETQTNTTLEIMENYLKTRRRHKFFFPKPSSSHNRFLEYVYSLMDSE